MTILAHNNAAGNFGNDNSHANKFQNSDFLSVNKVVRYCTVYDEL